MSLREVYFMDDVKHVILKNNKETHFIILLAKKIVGKSFFNTYMAVMSKLCMKYRILYWKKGEKNC